MLMVCKRIQLSITAKQHELTRRHSSRHISRFVLNQFDSVPRKIIHSTYFMRLHYRHFANKTRYSLVMPICGIEVKTTTTPSASLATDLTLHLFYSWAHIRHNLFVPLAKQNLTKKALLPCGIHQPLESVNTYVLSKLV